MKFEKKPFYSPPEVAKIMQTSRQNIIQKIWKGKIKDVVRIGKLWKIPYAEVKRIMKEGF